MGLSIAAVVHQGSNVYSIGNIIAFSRAEIYKPLLEDWINLPELMSQNPSKVLLEGSMVTLTGPVAIIKNPAAVKVGLVALAGFAAAALGYFVSSRAVGFFTEKKPSKADASKAHSRDEGFSKTAIAISVISSITAVALAWQAAARLPTAPGVYFFKIFN